MEILKTTQRLYRVNLRVVRNVVRMNAGLISTQHEPEFRYVHNRHVFGPWHRAMEYDTKLACYERTCLGLGLNCNCRVVQREWRENLDGSSELIQALPQLV